MHDQNDHKPDSVSIFNVVGLGHYGVEIGKEGSGSFGEQVVIGRTSNLYRSSEILVCFLHPATFGS